LQILFGLLQDYTIPSGSKVNILYCHMTIYRAVSLIGRNTVKWCLPISNAAGSRRKCWTVPHYIVERFNISVTPPWPFRSVYCNVYCACNKER